MNYFEKINIIIDYVERQKTTDIIAFDDIKITFLTMLFLELRSIVPEDQKAKLTKDYEAKDLDAENIDEVIKEIIFKLSNMYKKQINRPTADFLLSVFKPVDFIGKLNEEKISLEVEVENLKKASKIQLLNEVENVEREKNKYKKEIQELRDKIKELSKVNN